MAIQIGLNPRRTSSTAGGEFHSACPNCGGDDRFYIQPHKQMRNCIGWYRCRQCGISGDAIQFAREFLNLPFQEAADTVNANINEKGMLPLLKKLNTPQMITLTNPPKQWIARATNLVEQAHKQLLLKEDVLEYLSKRGLPIEIIQQYKLGWSTQDQFLSRTDWGLDEQLNDDGNPRKLWIPKGLVIPVSKPTGQIIRLKVRRVDDALPKYVAISGSMNGLSIIGDTKRTTMIVVESELDAYVINHVAHDFAFAVAVGSNSKNPDNVTDSHAKRASTLLICHDNDDAGYIMLTKWRSLYPHARGYSTPIGKDIGEAIQNEFNIREWLLQAI